MACESDDEYGAAQLTTVSPDFLVSTSNITSEHFHRIKHTYSKFALRLSMYNWVPGNLQCDFENPLDEDIQRMENYFEMLRDEMFDE